MADRGYLDRLARELTDKGLLIEAGWVTFRAAVVPKEASINQLSQMRMAFFAGAQHLFGSIISIMEDGDEPTENDMSRMDLIHNELQKFIKQFEKDIHPTEGNA